MHIEILLFDGFDELDAIAPWEILSGAARARQDTTAALVTLEGVRDVNASQGLTVRAQGALSPRPDLLLLPGGGWLDRNPEVGVWAEVERGVLAPALAERHRAGTVLASVCTGAMLLAHAGVLEGRRATTNPLALDELRAHGGIDVVEARVVDDGDILTAGAPSCGIDLGLHLLGRLAGEAAASAAARELQYEFPAVAAR